MRDASRPILFIVGCPRSGTYLLSSILNASGRVAIPVETHFVPLFRPYWRIAGDPATPAARRRLLRAIFMFLRIWIVRAEVERDYEAVSRHTLLAVEGSSERIAKEASGFEEAVLMLFRAYAELKGADIPADKSAFFAHVPLEEIDAAVAGAARYLHVIRDGRDVCLSWMKTRFGPASTREAALVWARHISGKRGWGRRNPARYREVRYEDLLNAPAESLRGVCEFVGLPYSDALLDFHSSTFARDLANSTTHTRLAQPLDASNQGKWRLEMPQGEIGAFERIASRELEACGYPLASPGLQGRPPGNGGRLLLARQRVRVGLKGLLPAFALISARLGIPLDRVCNSRVWLRVEEAVLRTRSL
jgi:hypothetical protein